MIDDGLGDWRFDAVTTLAKDLPAAYPGGPSHEAGSPVFLTTVTRNGKGDLVGFVTPSATALALDIAISAAKRAGELRSKVSYVVAPGPDGPVMSVSTESSPALFDFFEQCMISVTFSFQALEAFCNHSINRNLKGPIEVCRRRGKQVLAGEKIERELSTEEKLGEVVPRILSLQSPRGKTVWQQFIKLQKARDATVHLKASDQYPMSNMDKQTLFFQLLNHDPLEFPEAAVALINYFYDGKSKPRWLSMVPPTRT